MSVTTQAFTYAINHIESLMKQATTETKKTIDNSAFDENDYFVITLELTPFDGSTVEFLNSAKSPEQKRLYQQLIILMKEATSC